MPVIRLFLEFETIKIREGSVVDMRLYDMFVLYNSVFLLSVHSHWRYEFICHLKDG